MSDKQKPPATVYEDDDGPMPAGNAAMPPRPAPIQPMGSPGGMIQPMGRGGFGGAVGGAPAMPAMRGGGGPKTRLDEDDEVVERLMGFFVIIKSKMDEEHRYFRLRRGINYVGRFGSRGQVELRDNLVSEQHAIVVCTNTATRYVDLDSSNGSVINGDKSEYAELSEGDTIAVGSTTLMFIPFPFVAED